MLYCMHSLHALFIPCVHYIISAMGRPAYHAKPGVSPVNTPPPHEVVYTLLNPCLDKGGGVDAPVLDMSQHMVLSRNHV